MEIAGKEAVEGSWATFSPDVKNVPSAKRTVEAYEKRFGPVGAFSMYGYVAARLLLEGIKGAGASRPKDAKAVAEYLRKTPHTTVLGPIRFDRKGDVAKAPYVVYETRGGEFVQITGLGSQAQR